MTADRLAQALERIADPKNTHFAGDAQVVAREALAAYRAQSPAEGDAAPNDWKLPADLKAGHVTFRKGCHCSALVSRMEMLHREAFGPDDLTPAQKAENLAALQACKPMPHPPANVQPKGIRGGEVEQLRAAQTAAVMPLIGPLLDAWENADREVMDDEPELMKWLTAINTAMETAGEDEPAPQRHYGADDIDDNLWDERDE